MQPEPGSQAVRSSSHACLELCHCLPVQFVQLDNPGADDFQTGSISEFKVGLQSRSLSEVPHALGNCMPMECALPACRRAIAAALQSLCTGMLLASPKSPSTTL